MRPRNVERRRRAAGVALPPGEPVECSEFEESAVRKSDCESYDACLTYASRVGWANFDCASCPHYVQGGDVAVAARVIGSSLAAQRRELP